MQLCIRRYQPVSLYDLRWWGLAADLGVLSEWGLSSDYYSGGGDLAQADGGLGVDGHDGDEVLGQDTGG